MANARLDALLRRTQRDFKRLLDKDAATLSARLERVYASKRAQLRQALTLLAVDVKQGDVSTRDIPQMASYATARRDIERALQAMEPAITRAAKSAQALGLTAGIAFALMAGKAVNTTFSKPAAEMLNAFVHFGDNPQLQVSVSQYAYYHAEHMAAIVAANVAQGKSAGYTVRQMQDYYDGYPLADADRIVRTIQLYSAREATRQTYKDNGTVQGWIWSASLDGLVCPACVAMHGSQHSLDETMDSHYNCRCAMIPITPSWADLGFGDGSSYSVTTGEDWLASQPASVQESILGAAMYAAITDGQMTLSDVVGTYHDDVYGPMVRARSLTEIIGQDAARAYRRQTV